MLIVDSSYIKSVAVCRSSRWRSRGRREREVLEHINSYVESAQIRLPSSRLRELDVVVITDWVKTSHIHCSVVQSIIVGIDNLKANSAQANCSILSRDASARCNLVGDLMRANWADAFTCVRGVTSQFTSLLIPYFSCENDRNKGMRSYINRDETPSQTQSNKPCKSTHKVLVSTSLPTKY